MDKSPQKIKEMFNKIANIYDFNNNLLSFGFHKKIKKAAVSKINISGKALDLCTGTGDIAYYLSKKNCEVVGIDFSNKMLKIARKKYPKINFIEADCTNLPFDDNSFDIVTISFGLRNIENYKKALDEIYRVLKPNGIFMHLDFGKKNILGDIVFDIFVPILVRIFYKDIVPYEYLIKSKQMFFKEKELVKIFENQNLKVEKISSFLFGGAACQICKKQINNHF